MREVDAEQNDNQNYIVLRPKNSQPVVSEPIFLQDTDVKEQGQSTDLLITILLVGIIILVTIKTLLINFRHKKKQKVQTLIDCTTDRTLVYEEHIFSKEIDIFAYGLTGSIREHWRFPLKDKKYIKKITLDNNCTLISSEEYYKTKFSLETISEDDVNQGEVFSIYLKSGESFQHDMSEVKTDREYIKNVIMNFQEDHFTIEDADGVSSYKTCSVEAMTMEME